MSAAVGSVAQCLVRTRLASAPFGTRRPRLVVRWAAAAAAGAGRPAAPAQLLQPPRQLQQTQQKQQPQQPQQLAAAALPATAALWLLAGGLPAGAAELSGGPPASSYYVSLGLFLITLPGGLSAVPLA